MFKAALQRIIRYPENHHLPTQSAPPIQSSEPVKIPVVRPRSIYPLSESANHIWLKAHDLLQNKNNLQEQSANRFKFLYEIESCLKNAKDLSVSDRWFLRELCTCLHVFDGFFIKKYTLQSNNERLAGMTDKHYSELHFAIRDAFNSNSIKEKIIYASLLEPNLIKKFGLALSEVELIEVAKYRATRNVLLNHFELLALTDYLHPATFTFNVLNGAKRLEKFWRLDAIAVGMEPVYSAYYSALEKLSDCEELKDQSGMLYKGINGKKDFIQNERMLNYLHSTHGEVLVPHPISTTNKIEHCFSNDEDRDENIELRIKSSTGIQVGIFHKAMGKSLNEVILMDKRLRLIHRDTVYRKSIRQEQYTLEAEK
jgi:hypothetical protein